MALKMANSWYAPAQAILLAANRECARWRSEDCNNKSVVTVDSAVRSVDTHRRRRFDDGILCAPFCRRLAFSKKRAPTPRTTAARPAGNERLEKSRNVHRFFENLFQCYDPRVNRAHRV